MCAIACDINTIAKFLWLTVNNNIFKDIYVTTCLRPLKIVTYSNGFFLFEQYFDTDS